MKFKQFFVPINTNSDSNRGYKYLLIGSSAFFVFGLTSLAGSLMAQNITEMEVGNLFDPFFETLILCFMPLTFIKFLTDRAKSSIKLKMGAIYFVSLIFLLLSTLANLGQTYNFFVQQQNVIDQKLTTIENLYQERFDFLPRIQQQIDDSRKHELQLVATLVRQRSLLEKHDQINQRVDAINSFDRATKDLVIIESSSTATNQEITLAFINTINESETRLRQAKQAYNQEVLSYNRYLTTFPYGPIAKLMNFEQQPYLNYEQLIEE